MICRRMPFIALVLLTASVPLRADEVFVKGQAKSIKSEVRSETARDVQVDKQKPIAAADIIDIYYENIRPIALDLSGGAYKVARSAEKDAQESTDPAKRKAALKTAIEKYAETLKKMEQHRFAGRHFEFKIALLTFQKATSEQLPTEQAQVKLQIFKKNHGNSWQINQVMPLIAQIQMDAQDYKSAAETYQEMADMAALPEEMRRDAELKAVEISVRAGNLEQAYKKLDALAKKAGNNALLASRVKMARAEILVGQKKIAEAVPLVQQIIKENNDRQIKALAHNTLGECFYKAGRYNEAFWEFLWVDTVFNQDKVQRAKALYYLWQTFEQLNDAERAQECRESLLNDAQYAGTEYHRLAQAKTK